MMRAILFPYRLVAQAALYEQLIGSEEQRSSQHDQSSWNGHTSGWSLAVSYENYKSAREVLDRPQRM
ncbi:hypothetical protein [Reticulibacter mediterranei]|uniref:hypothetical protein n=1 Tax=Reticulibacter mediterranei TaxID=2778369 RepID=UPI001C688375|nr:hypothetical protein [Reticulibacter mediterranei]